MIFKGEFIFNDEYLGNLVFDNKGLLRERDLKVIVSGIYVFLLVIKVGILGGC